MVVEALVFLIVEGPPWPPGPLLGLVFLKQVSLLLPLDGHDFIVLIIIGESFPFDPLVFNFILKDLQQAFRCTEPSQEPSYRL